MSKLDDEIYNPKRSESIVPLYWEICKICKVPFKTCVFSKTCERCSVLLDERVRLFHSLGDLIQITGFPLIDKINMKLKGISFM